MIVKSLSAPPPSGDCFLSSGPGEGYNYRNLTDSFTPPSTGWIPGCQATSPAPEVTLVYKLTVTQEGSGDVTRDDTGVPGFPGYYTANTAVQLTASPDPGWEFTGWSGDLSGTVNPQTITMNSAKNVTATFQGLADYDVLLNVVGSGTVALNPPGGTYWDGTSVELTATADPPYWEFSGWSGDLSGTVNPQTVTMDSNKNVTATFSLKDSDGDGISDQDEDAGPNGGDANGDDILDSQQPNVVSTKSHDNQYDVWLEVVDPPGATLDGCQAVANPNPDDCPLWVDFPYGFFEFTIQNVGAGGAATLNLHVPHGEAQDTYYKFGPTPDDPNNKWYNFMLESATQTGAEINGDVITLHFVDGQRGDDDLQANGTIYDQGGPGVMSSVATSGGPGGGGGGSGGGSSGFVGGCFVAGTASRFYEAWLPCVVVILVLTIIAMLLAFRGRTSKRS